MPYLAGDTFTMIRREKLFLYLRIFLFIVYFVNGVICIRWNWLVSDETDHLSYGLRMLKGQPQKIFPYDDASTMPISAINALPRAIEQSMKPGLVKNDGGVRDALNGRYMTLLVCMLIGVFIYKWSRELWGEEGGLLSLFLFVFCPNLIANSTVVGTDTFAALFTLTSAYYFYRFLRFSGWRAFVLFSINLGLALISKQSLMLLPLIYAIVALGVLLKRRRLFSGLKLNIARFFVLSVIVLLIINMAFLFNGTGKSLTAYQFRSEPFLNLQQVKFLNNAPLPLPAPFIEGLDLVRHMISLGSGHEKVSMKSYLFGSYFTGNDRWYYYSVVTIFKTPLSVLILLFAVIFAYIKRIRSHAAFISTGLPLFIAFFFFFFISFNNTSQHGLRHLMMIYPLFYVCIGQVMQWKFSRKKIATGILVLYSLATFYSYFPNLVPYTNELLWNKSKVYKVFASANIDYGQTWKCIDEYLKSHPGVRQATSTPATGRLLVNINDFVGLRDTNEFAWLRKFRPVTHVAHTHLLFEITGEDLRQAGLKQ